MNVQQLIEQLQKMDSNAMVVLPGYEGGIAELRNIKAVGLKLNQNTEEWYGKHEERAGADADCVAIMLLA